MKKCPNCKLINPDNALVCDCGYDFKSKGVVSPKQESRKNLPSSNLICPQCGLTNFPTAARCDCGYWFSKEVENTPMTQEAAPRKEVKEKTNDWLLIMLVIGAIVSGGYLLLSLVVNGLNWFFQLTPSTLIVVILIILILKRK